MALKWFLSFTQVFGHTENVAFQSREIGTCTSSRKNLKGFEDGKEGRFPDEDNEGEYPNGFRMPLHYPRCRKSDYEKMEEWKLDLILKEYGLSFQGNTEQKREFAMGAFLWPQQL